MGDALLGNGSDPGWFYSTVNGTAYNRSTRNSVEHELSPVRYERPEIPRARMVVELTLRDGELRILDREVTIDGAAQGAVFQIPPWDSNGYEWPGGRVGLVLWMNRAKATLLEPDA